MYGVEYENIVPVAYLEAIKPWQGGREQTDIKLDMNLSPLLSK